MTTTRESWLMAFATELAPAFEDFGNPLPTALRISCGFPSQGARSATIGQCHYASSSADKHTEIFIHPKLAKPLEVGETILHELCHAALGPGFGHGKKFRKIATGMGLEGRMTSTHAGEEALALLDPIVEKLGPYPHGALSTLGGGVRKQSKNPHKNLTCPECGFRAKVFVDQMDWGRLVCPCDGQLLLTRAEMIEQGFC